MEPNYYQGYTGYGTAHAPEEGGIYIDPHVPVNYQYSDPRYSQGEPDFPVISDSDARRMIPQLSQTVDYGPMTFDVAADSRKLAGFGLMGAKQQHQQAGGHPGHISAGITSSATAAATLKPEAQLTAPPQPAGLHTIGGFNKQQQRWLEHETVPFECSVQSGQNDVPPPYSAAETQCTEKSTVTRDECRGPRRVNTRRSDHLQSPERDLESAVQRDSAASFTESGPPPLPEHSAKVDANKEIVRRADADTRDRCDKLSAIFPLVDVLFALSHNKHIKENAQAAAAVVGIDKNSEKYRLFSSYYESLVYIFPLDTYQDDIIDNYLMEDTSDEIEFLRRLFYRIDKLV